MLLECQFLGKGSKVILTVGRPAFTEPKEYTLTREEVRVFTVKDIQNRRAFPLSDDKIGYVRLTQFGDHTADELEEALAKLEKQGMKSLVMNNYQTSSCLSELQTDKQK